MIFRNNKTYNILKEIALKLLPALEVLTLSITEIWKLPYGTQIASTLAALDTALGIFLGISNKKYNEIIEEFETEVKKDHEVIEEE